MFTVSIAVVGAADLDDPCGLALFPAYANFLNVYGEINLIDMMAILVLLEQVLRQIVFKCFALNFEAFTKYRYDAIFFARFRFLCTGIKRRNYL